MKILADSTLPHLDDLFSKTFELTRYKNNSELHTYLPHHNILLCRSTLQVTSELLINTPIQCVATASSGVDHIDTTYLTTHGIKLIDAKGSNAESVADYIISTLAWLTKHDYITDHHAGVIGIGHVGRRIVSYLQRKNFHVLQYDPIAANLDPSLPSCMLHDLSTCDLLFIHANLHHTEPFPSKNLINARFLAHLKPGTIIINAARGGIVNEHDLLQTKQTLIYCTDVYTDEPAISEHIIAYSTLCTPHIAGHSIEAKSNAIETIAHALHAYYGFSIPPALNTTPSSRLFTPQDLSEYDRVLHLYNPIHETRILKQARDKTKAFLALRKAHHYRHHFSTYG